jgi:hypothetical protein
MKEQQIICDKTFRMVVLNLGSTDALRGPWIDLRGSVNLDGKKITILFSLTST